MSYASNATYFEELSAIQSLSKHHRPEFEKKILDRGDYVVNNKLKPLTRIGARNYNQNFASTEGP